MLIKPFLAKCGDRTSLPKAHPTCGAPEEWFSDEILVPNGFCGLTFDFFVNWSARPVCLTPVVWVKRILAAPHTYSQFIKDLQINLLAEFGASYLKRLVSFAKSHQLDAQLIIFRDDFDWKAETTELLLVYVSKGHSGNLFFEPFILTLKQLKQRIQLYSGGPVQLGFKGLFYGTSNLECVLSGSDSLYPGDVDLVLLNEADQPVGLLEFKKHSLGTPITNQRLSNYYPRPDGRKYDRLTVLKDYLSSVKGSDIPLMVLYYPTVAGCTEGMLEVLVGSIGKLATKAASNFKLPLAKSPEAYNLLVHVLKKAINSDKYAVPVTVKRVPVPEKVLHQVEHYLHSHNLGSRGVEDGSKLKQKVGLLGELVTHEYLHGNMPDLNEKLDGFDGGCDIMFRGYRIDVKTMERNSYVKPDFVNNFYILQEQQQADLLVFCSYHATDQVLEICGWMPKKELARRGTFYAAGTKRMRTNSTSFHFRQDNYEVENKALDDMDSLKKLPLKTP